MQVTVFTALTCSAVNEQVHQMQKRTSSTMRKS